MITTWPESSNCGRPARPAIYRTGKKTKCSIMSCIEAKRLQESILVCYKNFMDLKDCRSLIFNISTSLLVTALADDRIAASREESLKYRATLAKTFEKLAQVG